MYLTHVFLVVKVLSYLLVSFMISIIIAPILIRLLNKYKAWKKKPREMTLGGERTPIFTKLHAEKEVSVPRMGGILIWGTVLIVTGGAFFLARLLGEETADKINFISRSQTWLPLFTLISASILGLVDDILVVKNRGKYIAGGIRFKTRLLLIFLIALAGAWWF